MRIVPLICVLAAVFVLGALSLGVQYGSAQTATEQISARRAELERELANLEALMQEQQGLLANTQGERVTLERDVKILTGKIQEAKLLVRASELAIASLQDEIFDKEVTIIELDERLDRERESLAELIRRTAEYDDLSLIELVLSGKSISEFFEEVDDFDAVKVALHASSRDIVALREKNFEVKGVLEEKHESEVDAKAMRALTKKKLDEQEAEKARILKATKGQELEYQRLIARTEQSASEIRAELFELRGTSAINLGQAIEFANFASAKTGVRTAFILGVLKQETELGSNLGNCTYNEQRFGKPVMKPTRDQPVFLAIGKTLGITITNQPVSCSQSAETWGGAMGPSQFIPSTWACYGGLINTNTGDCSNAARSYAWDAYWAGPWSYDASRDRIRIIRGKSSPSNPWDNQDAFLATAMYMQELGADAGTSAAEHLAAMRYFGGYGGASNPSPYVRGYGDSVMGHTVYYQKQIDALKRLSEN